MNIQAYQQNLHLKWTERDKEKMYLGIKVTFIWEFCCVCWDTGEINTDSGKEKTKKRVLASTDGKAPKGNVGANSSKVFANNVMQSLYHTEQRLRLLAFEMHSSPVYIWGKTASIVLALVWFPVFSAFCLASELPITTFSAGWILASVQLSYEVLFSLSNFMRILPQFEKKQKSLWDMLYCQNCTVEHF